MAPPPRPDDPGSPFTRSDSELAASPTPATRADPPSAPPDPPSAVPPSAAPPSPAGRYEVLGEIGRGGMGAVLHALDPELKRELAVKVLLERHEGRPEVERRFLEEAQIGGQLQHPGLVPVYEVGRFPDRRPYFTMKLVRGRTLAALLAERPDPGHDLPHFLQVFEQVCQTTAYAHARGVIHRDLKPANVMVGAFGEVQVMDWGLAKVLPRDGKAPREAAPDDAASIHTVRSDDDGWASRAGSVLGTPAYMSPEQARGEADAVDERADVFGLGALLCELLTGRAPYGGEDGRAVLRQAARADLTGAFSRLGVCGADGELVELAKACLAAERAQRPRDAAAVAARVAAHRAGVQERLRRSELERAAATARAAAERRARRLTAALALTGLLLLGLGGGAAWYVRQQQLERSAKVEADLQETAGRQREEKWDQAWAALERAEGRLNGAGDEELARRVRRVRGELEQIRKDGEMVARLEKARLQTASCGKKGDFDREGAHRLYQAAFAWYGIPAEQLDPQETGERVRGSAICDRLVDALEDWGRVESRDANVLLSEHLYKTANGADPNERRRRLRQASTRRDWDAVERSVSDGQAFALSPSAIVHLGRIMRDAGRFEKRLELLREAQRRTPGDFWLTFETGNAYHDVQPPRLAEAARCYTAAISLRPRSTAAHRWLGFALLDQGQPAAAAAEFKETLDLSPDDVYARNSLGLALQAQNRPAEAAAAYKEVLRLRPDFTEARLNLGDSLVDQGKTGEAEAEYRTAESAYRQAVRLRPGDPEAHSSLGIALQDQGKYAEAAIELKEAVCLAPNFANAYLNLGDSLKALGCAVPAEAAYREVLRLQPDYPAAHTNLGALLADQGKLPEAEVEYREALRLKPDLPEAHNNLGNALAAQGKAVEAVVELKEAFRLRPAFALPHNNLGNLFREQGKGEEAVAEYREAIRHKPDYIQAHLSLVELLKAKGESKEAEVALRGAEAVFREAVHLKSDSAEVHRNLGDILAAWGKSSEAVTEYRKALSLQPDDADSHAALAYSLQEQGETVGAVTEYKEALRLNPDSPDNHVNLGRALQVLGKHPEAEAVFRAALRLNPDSADAHFGIGFSLRERGNSTAAAAEYKETVRLKSDYTNAQINLGLALQDVGKHSEAEDALREAVRLNANDPKARYNLGVVLKAQGKRSEALSELREALRLKPQDPNICYCLGLVLEKLGDFPNARLAFLRSLDFEGQEPAFVASRTSAVREVERLIELDKRLPALSRGGQEPRETDERRDLANLCAWRRQYLAAVAYFAEDFAASPWRIELFGSDAAAAALLASLGKDESETPTEEVRTRLRAQAAEWLTAALKHQAALFADKPESSPAVRMVVTQWRWDEVFASVRDEAALQNLSATERSKWRKLWADVDALLKKTRPKE